MTETYYEDEDGILRGDCSKHGEFVGDAIGCPECFMASEMADAEEVPDESIKTFRGEAVGEAEEWEDCPGLVHSDKPLEIDAQGREHWCCPHHYDESRR